MPTFSRSAVSLVTLTCTIWLCLASNMVIAAEQEEAPSPTKASDEKTAAKTTLTDESTKNSDKDNEANTSESKDDNNALVADKATGMATDKRNISAPADLFKQQQQDIKHYLVDEQVESILVGTDEYLMLVDQHTTAINKGVMILVPDWQQSAASPSALKQLRMNMPAQGWTLLTIHPPHQPENYPSQALTAQLRIEENRESLKPYQSKLAAVINEVVKKAKNYPGAILTVAEGKQAAFMVNMIQKELIEPTSAMIMLSSYMPTVEENTTLAEQVALSEYPILDLYLKRDHRLVIANAKSRKDRAKNELKVYYRQKQLNNQITGKYPKYSLTRSILGWLKSIGW